MVCQKHAGAAAIRRALVKVILALMLLAGAAHAHHARVATHPVASDDDSDPDEIRSNDYSDLAECIEDGNDEIDCEDADLDQ